MNGLASAIYVGHVSHRRLRPKKHSLCYRSFMLLLDLDELPVLAQRSRWFSRGRFNLLSFHDRDHGDGSSTPLRQQIEGHLAAADLAIDGGPIRLLCMPRILGYVFNPISVYFCHRPDGSLAAILYEVSSTFGERHSYLAPVADDARGIVRQNAAKRLHVSPFMEMALQYDFSVLVPGEHLRVAIDAIDAQGPILTASFAGQRQAFDGRALLAAWAAHPLLTIKVLIAIHWEALKLASKGVRLRPGPPAPAAPVSLGAAGPAQLDRR